MNLQRISDISIPEIISEQYDLGIFAAGFERRSNSVPLFLKPRNFKKVLVFGFIEEKDYESRENNNTYFLENWAETIILVSANDEGEIYTTLNNLDLNQQDSLKILIDYSSMSRLWYAGILNWLKFNENYKNVIVDFCYSAGEYKNEVQPLFVEKIISIPGCEGSTQNFSKSVAIFGLGFDGSSTLWALDRLEPDIVFAYYANPSIFPDYPERTRRQNSELLNEYASGILEIPLLSCESTFRYLGELISTYINNSDITIIPMGPKPHILSAILLSFRFKEITCLYINGKRERTELINPTGHYAVSRVSFLKLNGKN